MSFRPKILLLLAALVVSGCSATQMNFAPAPYEPGDISARANVSLI